MKPTLGQYLASIRLDRRMSLRQVEELSKKEVSNAYLSQLENGKILQPSPSILGVLAEIYGVDHLQLMQLAGYLPKKVSFPEGSQSRMLFAEHNLSEDEEGQLIEYLKFLRSRKKHAG
jgi:HTH-type transcriptional regulator, competence development regulator